ncbi:class I tRNA ligase family protein, partial [Bacillus subtilis]
MDNQELTMPTKYDPSAVEKNRYDYWVNGKFFEAKNDPEKEPYTVVIPPPNVTGKLHLGHAWDSTLQDIVTRM